MGRSIQEERDYLVARSADHRRMAGRARGAPQRALHERFAALYAARADALLVEVD
ncbi:hypothetical protein GCM10011380_09170 [Sphingomonas metalli]|uniref:Uncharacterized protein n=1 Tax=Sphingomonas metalli TaxID=1779358 RepID=A0A916WQT0_9SPHN|nr:hypothetical protein [Sphingomonas metalli]GGB21751.1 hypothetical protein GCM10011380_09170 [Sphingomonas metalli]